MRKHITTITTAVLAVTLLAGCSGGGSGDGGGGAATDTAATKTAQAAPSQTKKEACDQLEDALRSFVSEQMSTSAPADPKSRADVVDGFTDRIDAALPKVGNAEVKTDFEAFTKAAKGYADALESSGSTTSDAVTAAEAKVQQSLTAISADCPAK